MMCPLSMRCVAWVWKEQVTFARVRMSVATKDTPPGAHRRRARTPVRTSITRGVRGPPTHVFTHTHTHTHHPTPARYTAT